MVSSRRFSTCEESAWRLKRQPIHFTMRQRRKYLQDLDWTIVLLCLILMFIGWFSVYSAVFDASHQSIFDLEKRYGKQLLWIGGSALIFLVMMALNYRTYYSLAFLIYGFVILLLILVLFIGKEINGAKSWLDLGGFRLQPAEFAKFATALALASYLSTYNLQVKSWKTKFTALGIIFLPLIFVILQNDTGSALVFFVFILVLYRENVIPGGFLFFGLISAFLAILTLVLEENKIYILVGLGILALLYIFLMKKKRMLRFGQSLAILLFATGIIFSVNSVFNNVLADHHKDRINNYLTIFGKEKPANAKGTEYNLNQSLIAIGSGGAFGKGYLEGTQTKFRFVPEQSTDFIFCTIGEEFGFMGSLILLVLFGFLLFRIILIAERQVLDFARIYGYGVASIIFFHVMINLGTTIGTVPIIGIPLPFISYGGSSLWGFTILITILLKFDSERKMVLR